MNHLFFECSSLEYLDLSNFDTSKVSQMRFMFYNCSSLKELNLSNFKIKNVNDMKGIFSMCSHELISHIKTNYKEIINKAFN